MKTIARFHATLLILSAARCLSRTSMRSCACFSLFFCGFLQQALQRVCNLRAYPRLPPLPELPPGLLGLP
jgi:hypothetical protein